MERACAHLLLVPLALGNLDVAQANPLVIGLLMGAVSSAQAHRWARAALCVAVATSFKIYPLSLGLLLILIAPPRFYAYLAGSLAAFALLPFAFQPPGYVRALYSTWISTRAGDDRLEYSARHAPLDLWLLLNRLFGCHIPESWYRLVQVGGGAAIALFVLMGRKRGWERGRILAGLFVLACIWMTLLGPATEGFTYVLLAPAVVMALLETGRKKRPLWLKSLAGGVALLLFAAVTKNSLIPALRHSEALRLTQPLAALLFLFYSLAWLLNGSYWNRRAPETA